MKSEQPLKSDMINSEQDQRTCVQVPKKAKVKNKYISGQEWIFPLMSRVKHWSRCCKIFSLETQLGLESKKRNGKERESETI